MSGSLRSVVESGGRREILEELALRLADAIDSGPEPKDLAALSLRLEKVTAELQALPAQSKGASFEDRLAARREARKAANG